MRRTAIVLLFYFYCKNDKTKAMKLNTLCKLKYLDLLHVNCKARTLEFPLMGVTKGCVAESLPMSCTASTST